MMTVRIKAMNLLAQREHSCQELSAKLAKAFPGEEETINLVILALQTEGLLSDRRFMETCINSRIRKGQGPVRISAELRHRGIAEELIEEGMRQIAVDWVELARQVRVKKFGNGQPRTYQERAQVTRFLHYRGFGTAQISACLEQE